MQKVKTISFSDFDQNTADCFQQALRGSIVRITHGNRDAILIGDEQWLFVMENLELLERLLSCQHTPQ